MGGGGWVCGGWTKTTFMLFSTQVEVVVELKLELSLAIGNLIVGELGPSFHQQIRVGARSDNPEGGNLLI